MRINLAIADINDTVPSLLRDMDIVLNDCGTPTFEPDEEGTGTTPPSGWADGTHLYVSCGAPPQLVQRIRCWAAETVGEAKRGFEIHSKEKLDEEETCFYIGMSPPDVVQALLSSLPMEFEIAGMEQYRAFQQ